MHQTNERQKSGATTAETPDAFKVGNDSQIPETKAMLEKLQSEVSSLGGRLNQMSQSMPSATENLRDKLRQMEEEKDETEQVLSNLRGKLDEQKKISNLKRQRLKQRQEAANISLNTTSSTAAVGPDHGNGSFTSLVLEGLEDISEIHEHEASDYSSFGEREVRELERKIRDLELQKEEMEQTLLELLSNYEHKTQALQQEKSRLEDDKDTTYQEMKGLLVEQHHESERLRTKVSKMELKRKKTHFFAKTGVLSMMVALLSIGVYFLFWSEDWSTVYASRNHACAPARPGSQISQATGSVEAPWWAPKSTKPFFFALLCGDRPRIRLEIQRGTLFISLGEGHQVTKKFGDKAYIEADMIHISDRTGGHQEMVAPWYKPDAKSTKKG